MFIFGLHKKLGGATTTIMNDLLAFETNCRTIGITINKKILTNL